MRLTAWSRLLAAGLAGGLLVLGGGCAGSRRSSSTPAATPGDVQTEAESYAPAADTGSDYGDAPTATASMDDAESAPSVRSAGAASYPRATPSRAPRPAPPPQVAQAAGQPAAQAPEEPARGLLLIYTANLYLAVFEAQKALSQVEALVADAKGYLVQRADTQITVRVPAEAFTPVLEAIAKVGDELHRTVQVQDVTAEFRDLESRLQNLKVVRERLQQLLDKAQNVNEALVVEQQLERVTGEIEQIKGRMKYLGEMVAYSTITVQFQARPVEQVTSTVELPFPWLGELGLSRLLNLSR